MSRIKQIDPAKIFRYVVIAVLLAIQAAALYIMLERFQSNYPWFSVACAVLSLVVVIYIIGRDSASAYKIVWIILIMALPIFGGLFYLLCGRNRFSRREERRMLSIYNKTCSAMRHMPSDLARLEQEQPDSARHASYIARAGAAPPFAASASRYLPDGALMYEQMLAQIETAEKYIFLEFFIIREGKMWNELSALLERKAAQGVDVRIIYDDVGSLGLPPDFPRRMEARGFKCCVFNQLSPILTLRFNNRDHRKICVIDGRCAFTGGINIADEYIHAVRRFGFWKDTGVMVQGPAAWSLTLVFLSMWDLLKQDNERFANYLPQATEPLPDDGFVQPFADSPLDGLPLGENVYLNLISRAKRYVYICTPYLAIGNELITALCMAARSGVDVRMITPYIADKKIVHHLTRSYYPVLKNSGVRIFEYRPGFIHAKTFVVDDEQAVVGTINMDYRSLHLHFECGVALYGCASIADMREDFLATQSDSVEVNELSCRHGALKRLFYSCLRIIAPLL